MFGAMLAKLNLYLRSTYLEKKFQYYYCSKERDLFTEIGEFTVTVLGKQASLSVHSIGDIKRPPLKSDNTAGISFALEKIEILLDLLWETINTGHWKDVDIFWRQLYLIVSYMKAIILTLQDDVLSALTCCDMGIIMGAPLSSETCIQDLAESIQRRICNEKIAVPAPEISVVIEKSAIPLPWLPNVRPVPHYTAPSLERFFGLIKTESPFVMKNVIAHWPALGKWSPEYLVHNFGERLVPIEVGSSYTSDSWTQKLVKLKDFVNEHVTKTSPNKGYLAQYELLNHITNLRRDITPLDYCAVSQGAVITNCWFGPEGTVSPLHHDHYQNLFCQVYGHKRFILFDRDDNLHPHTHRLLENTSQIDVESVSARKAFPGYAGCRAWTVDLSPGDVLYIPLKWWHHVRSLSVSFSVSFWWKKSVISDDLL